MLRRLRLRFFLTAVFVAGLAQNAAAHPHVWVSARAQVIFDAKGEIEAIRHAWTFDEMYSAFVTEGQGKDGELMTKEELAPLAKSNVESLAEFDYFTYAKVANAKVEFGTPIDYSLEQREDKLVVLRFTLPLKTPASAAKAFSFQVYDPTYFVAFEMEKQDPVGIAGAPKGCSTNLLGSKPLAADDTKKLSNPFSAVFRRAMISGSNSRAGLLSLVREGLVDPNRVFFRGGLAACGASLAAARPVWPLALLCMVVLASSQSLGQGVHHPFAVGANEGATGSAQGVSGWILAREAGFYRLLSGAIRAAKQSGAAAWGLTGLSLAYGIFHAAGPGHGKMVIASYMLADERALRRGLVIAFGAALLQGFSAIAIVGIGASSSRRRPST